MYRTHLLVAWANLCALVLFAGIAPARAAEVGDRVQAFNANDHNGDLWQWEDHLAKGKYLVVYFYPAAMTGGCTRQACSYRDRAPDINDLNVEVVGVSADPVNSLRIFQKSEHLNFRLLSDVNATIAARFGVPVKPGGSLQRVVDGREVELTRPFTFARWTFVVGPDGKVLRKDTLVTPEADPNSVLEFVRARAESPRQR